MAQENKYLGKLGLPQLIEEIKSGFAKLVHTHKLSEITDYTVDSEIKSDSENPVQNQVIKEALDLKVPIMRTVNGKSLEADINLSASDVGTMTSEEITSGLDSKANISDVAYIDIEDNENIEYEDVRPQAVELIDNLESTSTTAALTANQGRVLKGYINELSGEVDTLNTNVTTLSSNKADKNVIDELSSSIDELNSNKADKSTVNGLSSSIDELNKKTDIVNGNYRFAHQNDGNFVIYDSSNKVVFASNEVNNNLEQVFQLGTSRKAQLISSLPSKFGLTTDNTWSEIFETLAAYYPATFNILSNFSSSNWIYTQQNGTFTYNKGVSIAMTALRTATTNYCDARSSSFDLTPYSTITCTYSQTGTKNYVHLITSSGEINLNSGTTDISNYSGDAQIRIYCHSYPDGSGYYADGKITVSSIILTA